MTGSEWRTIIVTLCFESPAHAAAWFETDRRTEQNWARLGPPAHVAKFARFMLAANLNWYKVDSRIAKFEAKRGDPFPQDSMDRLTVIARDVGDRATDSAIDLALIETERVQIDRAQAENWALLREDWICAMTEPGEQDQEAPRRSGQESDEWKFPFWRRIGDFVANIPQLERSVDALKEENKRLRDKLKANRKTS